MNIGKMEPTSLGASSCLATSFCLDADDVDVSSCLAADMASGCSGASYAWMHECRQML